MPSLGRVYILDDEERMVRILSKMLTREGCDVVQFTDPREAVRGVERDPPDVLVSDIAMPGMDGLEVLARVRAAAPATRVILLTAFGTIDGAIRALKDGAVEYVTKPFDTADLIDKVKAALARGVAAAPGAAAAAAPGGGAGAAPTARPATAPQGLVADPDWARELERRFIGASPLMAEVRLLLRKVAPTDSPVLIRGESGTGKEVAARALHDMSARAAGRFVPVNCAAIPETLVESELFGYERGAFTGATQRKVGLVEAAHGGTLFLDEVTELPLAMQAKLLRVLQEREVQRIGGIDLIPVDVRIIAAGNRDIEEMIELGEFRSDLFYRLNVIRVTMPTLRDRIEDLDALAAHIVARVVRRRGAGGGVPRLGEVALARLRAYSWPGNVRELENVLERMVILGDREELGPELLPDEIAFGEERMLPSQLPRTPIPTKFRLAKEQFERRYLVDLLRKAGGSVTAASQISGISRRNLYDKIEKLGLDIEAFKGRRGGPGPGPGGGAAGAR